MTLLRCRLAAAGATLAVTGVSNLVTHALIPSALFGLIAGIFISAGMNDLDTGTISNTSMAAAALAALALQVVANCPLGAMVRTAVVAILWAPIAAWRFSRGGIGGGDLKMVGVTWLVIASFPAPTALLLLLVWALALSALIVALRLGRVRHLRAGLSLAGASILTNLVGLAIFTQVVRN